MARSAVELDFFRMEKEAIPEPQPPKLFQSRRSFRDIQGVISKLNPELLKAVIASGSVDQVSCAPNSSENSNSLGNTTPFSAPSTPKHDALPLGTASESTNETAPMTIFYNGVVTIFDVPRSKAESILKLAVGEAPKTVTDQCQLLETLNADLPMARRKSLQRFLEKRKERLTLMSPYGTEYASSCKSASGGRD